MSTLSDAFMRIHQELAAAEQVYLHVSEGPGLANAPLLRADLAILSGQVAHLLRGSRGVFERMRRLQYGHDEET